MPQLLLLALAGAGVYVAGRLIGNALRMHDQAGRDQAASAAPAQSDAAKDLGHLRKDPETGIYRPNAG